MSSCRLFSSGPLGKPLSMTEHNQGDYDSVFIVPSDYQLRRASLMVPQTAIRIRRFFISAVVLTVAVVDCTCGLSDVAAEDDVAEIKLTDRVPYGREAVDYFGTRSDDAVSRLSRQLESGVARLVADDQFGYLLSVLDLLHVPLESQTLVYSKTARAPELVSPKSPRAIFFNDEVSVAWIPESRELEITAADPVKGINFYTLSQPLDSFPTSAKPETKVSDSAGLDAQPGILRRDRCLACHSGRSSLEVPGLLLRAFQTDRTGKPLVGFSRMTHDMNIERRWGGWYVTGSPPDVVHRGNLLSQLENDRHKREPGFASSLQDLSQKIDVDGYPHPGSNFVAHLVFSHQAHGTNLLIRAGMEARLNRRSDVEDQLVRYFVFADEAPLDMSAASAVSVLDRSEFAASFAQRGPCDSKGNSFRELSLVGRVFKNRLSYLIHSRWFDELPGECRDRLLNKFWTGLASETAETGFDHLGLDERNLIIEIVRATVPRLPKCWEGNAAVAR